MQENSNDKIISAFFNAFRLFKQKLDLNNPLYHLPMAQMETLRLIGEEESVPMKQVADFLAITPPSATVLINNLVKLGFVQRNSDKLDRRAVHLSLTKKGKVVLQEGIKQRCKRLMILLKNLSKTEQTQLLTILTKMSRDN